MRMDATIGFQAESHQRNQESRIACHGCRTARYGANHGKLESLVERLGRDNQAKVIAEHFLSAGGIKLQMQDVAAFGYHSSFPAAGISSHPCTRSAPLGVAASSSERIGRCFAGFNFNSSPAISRATRLPASRRFCSI